MGRRQWDKPTHERLLSSTTSLFLALIAFLCLFFAPPSNPLSLLVFLFVFLSLLSIPSPFSSSSLSVDSYDGIHPSFFTLANKHHRVVVRRQPNPKADQFSPSTLLLFLPLFPLIFIFYLSRERERETHAMVFIVKYREAKLFCAESSQSLQERDPIAFSSASKFEIYPIQN